ncbi:amidase [Rhizobium puerariae]|uniref:Amidase n=1 Tax=Rhizobium puerariae TaxID=1585791 RepID=A0ABV6AJA9_9HYPH
MAYHFPDVDGLSAIARELGMNLNREDAIALHALMDGMTPAMRLLETLSPGQPEIKYPRTPGYRPDPSENRYNAWRYKTSIKGAPTGKLAGRTVAIKDNVCVAGVPMSNGSSILEGFVPDVDATVVTRILDAGAEITGKSTCEYLCLSGNSSTSADGPVENPNAPGCTTGGSSNGSAALVAAGEVDLAIGADQAGSIRMPASFTGIVGHKPTWGLVPYTGALSIEYTFDHLGPMARSVADCALLLEVIAGNDGIDGRWRGARAENYTEALGRGVKGLRIGVVKEGFGREESEEGVDAVVRAAAARLQADGTEVEEISIPWHLYGTEIWKPIALEGNYMAMMYGNGVGYGRDGDYSIAFMRAFSGWQKHIDELAATGKTTVLAGEIFRRHGGMLYAKAHNLRRRLRAEYDAALARYDVLVMPTTPMTARKIVPHDAPILELLTDSWTMQNNTCPFDITGHPAISVPCGHHDGKPVGFMIVGRHFDDATVFRVADAV